MGALDRLGNVKAPTREIAREVHAHLESVGKPLPVYPSEGSQVIWGYNAGGAEHGTGRALDFMVMSPNNPAGDEIVNYVWKHRERFGLIHVIWKQRIKSTRTSPGRWRKMSNRGSPTNNHMDHPHVLFDGRAVKAKTPAKGKSKPAKEPAKKSTGKAPAFPLPKGHYFGPKAGPTSSVSGYFSHRSDLRRWQTRMRDRGWRITPDGLYGPSTRRVAYQFQRDKGLAVDGLIGADTWRAAWASPVT